MLWNYHYRRRVGYYSHDHHDHERFRDYGDWRDQQQIHIFLPDRRSLHRELKRGWQAFTIPAMVLAEYIL